MSENGGNESAALGIDDDTPELYALVDLTTLEGISFVKRAPLERILLWGAILGMDGRQTKRLDSITSLEHLQYLYWNTTQLTPSDDLNTLINECAKLANNLSEDTTSVEELRSRIPAELLNSLDQHKGENTVGQGSATDGAIEKKGKGGKKSAKSEGTEAAAKEAKPKKEKDPNGRPGEGTSTRKVWDIADSLVLQSGNNVTPTRAAVIEAAIKAGVNKATAGVQYGAWFKGMKRAPAPVPEKAEAATSGEAAK